MGLLPFAFTIGTNPTVIPGTARARWWRGSPWSSSPRLPQSRFSSSHNFASCFGTARCPDAVARLAGIRGGVSRRTSGQTLSRSVRGDRSVAERGPPSGP
jgi:hypothetical protein